MTIKEARLAAGLTQKAMSEMLGIPKRTIEEWEAGKRTPPTYVEKLVVEKLESIKKERDNMKKVLEWLEDEDYDNRVTVLAPDAARVFLGDVRDSNGLAEDEMTEADLFGEEIPEEGVIFYALNPIGDGRAFVYNAK